MRKILLPLLLASLATLGLACTKADEPQNRPRPATLITVAPAAAQPVRIIQESVGQADSETAPFVAAEVAGRVTRIHVDVGSKVNRGQVLAELDANDQRIARQAAAAELARVEAQLQNQQRVLERYRQLVQDNFVSQAALDENESQLAVLRGQHAVAQAQMEAAERNLARTRITAPVTGQIEQRLVAHGDFVSVGNPLFRIATTRNFRVRLPFPETAAPQLRTGLTVLLSTPSMPGKIVEGRVTDIRPMIGAGTRAIEVIAAVNNGDWRPGASVNGVVIVSEHEGVTVPSTAVVLRPAGEVVYVIGDGKAEQRVVRPGVRTREWIEIVSGVDAGEMVAVDGAAFLTDQTPVTISNRTDDPAGDGT